MCFETQPCPPRFVRTRGRVVACVPRRRSVSLLFMPHTFGSYRTKLDRAVEHVDALDHNIGAWLGSHPYGLTIEHDLEQSEGVLRIRDIQDPPQRISVGIGDYLHAIRSALDHLAYDLAVAFTGDPLSGEGRQTE